MSLTNDIFNINSVQSFNNIAIEVFKFQYESNQTYNQFCKFLNIDPNKITQTHEIPFLPIEFFKSHEIKSGIFDEEVVFLSSGTTGQNQSKHYLKDLLIYQVVMYQID